MGFRLLLLTLLTALLGTARADEIALTYDILMGKRPVGQRTVTLRTIPADGDFPETRLITAETQLDARVVGLEYAVHSRVDARITDSKTSFVSSTRTNGDTVEVQGRTDLDGNWLVSRVTAGQVETLRYRPIEVDLTSIDLQDPTRRSLLDPSRGTAEVLLVETGTVAEGPTSAQGIQPVQVGGASLSPEIVMWTAPTGPVRMGWNQDGILVFHEMRVLGKPVVARLRELPPQKSWGSVQVGSGFVDSAAAIGEEEL